jgi:hypothetical protein
LSPNRAYRQIGCRHAKKPSCARLGTREGQPAVPPYLKRTLRSIAAPPLSLHHDNGMTPGQGYLSALNDVRLPCSGAYFERHAVPVRTNHRLSDSAASILLGAFQLIRSGTLHPSSHQNVYPIIPLYTTSQPGKSNAISGMCYCSVRMSLCNHPNLYVSALTFLNLGVQKLIQERKIRALAVAGCFQCRKR